LSSISLPLRNKELLVFIKLCQHNFKKLNASLHRPSVSPARLRKKSPFARPASMPGFVSPDERRT
jgi:hypothetical protein